MNSTGVSIFYTKQDNYIWCGGQLYHRTIQKRHFNLNVIYQPFGI